MNVEISEDTFKGYFTAKGMGSYSALDDIFTSEDDDPRGTEYKNALLISMTGLPAISDSKTFWRNNEIYQFELYHLQKMAIKRIRELLQKFPGGPYLYYNDCSSLAEFSTFGTPVIDAGRIKCPAGGTHQVKWTETGGFELATRYIIKMETDDVSGSPSCYVSTESDDFYALWSIGIYSGKLKWLGITDLQDAVNSTEYEIEVIINWTTRTAEVIIDSDSKGTTFPLDSPNALNFFRITLSNASNKNAWFDDLTVSSPPGYNIEAYEKIPDFPNPVYLGKRFNGMHKWRIIIEIQKTEEVPFE